MKADVQKKISGRVTVAFEDLLGDISRTAREQILLAAENMVQTVWIGKIYAALPKDKTTVPEYFLDAELEQFLNEAIEECHAKICQIAAHAKNSI